MSLPTEAREAQSNCPTPIQPIILLKEQSASSPRRIEDCWWYHPVEVDFDITPGELPQDPLHRDFTMRLGQSLINKGHTILNKPGDKTNMVIGFYDIPQRPGSLFDKVVEVDPPLALAATKRYKTKVDGKEVKFPALDKNYTVVVTIDDDIAHMKKREAEKITRMLMARIGALKIIMIHKGKDGKPDYYALGTMEGGLAIEDARQHDAIDKFADRLITHCCARESGSFIKAPDVIDREEWDNSPVPDYIAKASRQLASWGYIDKPFDVETVASKKRARLINIVMGWSRQSESAIAAWDPFITAPEKYHMGPGTGVIVSSKSGRFNVDKTWLERGDTIPVAIVPKPNYTPGLEPHLTLENFKRYLLGIRGDEEVAGPSIEFDEMSAAILNSGYVRVRKHPSGYGFILDMEKGDIWLPRVRGFVHMHQGIEKIFPQQMWTRDARELVEYVPANLHDYPYPVGCGKDIMFACSTDAAQRSHGVKSVGSGIQVALFDALDHGTNALLLTEPIPGTDGYIPEDPFDAFLQLVNLRYGAVRLINELAMV